MRIQVSTDSSIQGSAGMIQGIEEQLHDALDRFSEQITRIEVHLSDVDGLKSKGHDKKCLLEARLAGRQPMVVNHQAPNLKAAVDGAAAKLEKTLDNLVGKLRQRKGRSSFSGDETETE